MSLYTTPRVRQPQPIRRSASRPSGLPPLAAGDRLGRAEFERRYLAHPEIRKAELVEGVVYVPSLVHYAQHGQPHFNIVTWLGVYHAGLAGVSAGDNVTVRLDFENEVQPDALLRLEPAHGGRSRVTKDDFLEGAPELIVEIAASSAAYDLHDKRRAYSRNGVQEYLVAQVYERRLDWFVLQEGVYAALKPDAAGVLRSQVFPGLWLQSAAFWAGDLATMLAVLQEGLASPAYAAFRARLQAG